ELQYADWTVESLGNVDYQFAFLRKFAIGLIQMVKSIRSRGMTNAERQAKWRAAHPSAPADRARAAARSGMMVALIPRGPLDLRELDNSAGTTLALYDRLINIIAAWLETLDVAALSTADGFLAFRLLGPTLESLAIIRAKIGEQRAEEAHDVTA